MAETVGAATVPANPPFARGAFMWRKAGPLPVWAYALIVLGLLLLFVWLRRGKAADQQATAVAGQDASTIAANTPKQPVFIVPQATPPAVNVAPPNVSVTNTIPAQPPGSGRDNPPGAGTPFLVSAGTGADLYQFTAAHGGWDTVRALNPWFDSNRRWGPDKYSDGSWVPHVITGRPYLVTK